MALDAKHPEYDAMLPDWEKMRDVYKGERHVKEQGRKYLPPTQGMLLDGYGKFEVGGAPSVGQSAYEAYRLRAVLPDYLQDAVEMFMGLLHSQPPKIELPDSMEPLREKATEKGESLEQLLRRMNEEQLVTGRLGLLLDMPSVARQGVPMPYIAMYVAESIINWDDAQIEEGEAKLNLVVLDESGYARPRGNFDWQWYSKYRVLELEPLYDEDNNITGWGPYQFGVFGNAGTGSPDYVTTDMRPPVVRAEALPEIPFVFVNTKDIVASPDKPTLLGLANLCLTIFRGEADYRQNLFLQGQDTLVLIGDIKKPGGDPNELAASDSAEPLRTGTGALIHMQEASDAKYIGVNSSGLPEQRTALENDRKRAESKSVALPVGSGDTGAESGEALKTRVGARTASLNSIAITGAAALQWMLRKAAQWMGADPEKVKVTPNMEFADYQMSAATLVQLMAARAAGAPLSRESIHALMAEGGLTKLDYETEKDKVDEEKQDEVPPGTTAGGNPDNPQQQPGGQGA